MLGIVYHLTLHPFGYKYKYGVIQKLVYLLYIVM